MNYTCFLFQDYDIFPFWNVTLSQEGSSPFRDTPESPSSVSTIMVFLRGLSCHLEEMIILFIQLQLHPWSPMAN